MDAGHLPHRRLVRGPGIVPRQRLGSDGRDDVDDGPRRIVAVEWTRLQRPANSATMETDDEREVEHGEH